MSSVAKCLVLAGVALEADALLLQTGAQHECKEHGCSNDSKAADGNDICKAYEVTKGFDDAKKKSATVAAGAKEPTDGKVKIDGTDYSCKEKECPRGENKKMEMTKPEHIQANLKDNTNAKVADMCAESKKAKADEPAKPEAQPLCAAIAAVNGAAKGAVKTITKGDGKTVKVTIGEGEPAVFKCEAATDEKCNKATGDGTTGDTPKPEDVDAAGTKGGKGTQKYADGVAATAFKTECGKS